jgi:trehalose-phosphatase
MLEEALIKNIKTQLDSRALFAVFDRDGTLVPYNSDPKKAVLSPDVKKLLQELANCQYVTTAILSARDIQQLRIDFGEANIILAGNYGMEIIFSDKSSFVLNAASSARPLLEKTKEKLQQLLSSNSKTILEDHGLTLCLHWHLTPPDQIENVHNTVQQVQDTLTGLTWRKLPTSYEIWPAVSWGKAHGLDEIARVLKIDWHKCFVLYAGDSTSDEDAFDWVNQHHGISVNVGKNRPSAAQFNIDSPAGAAELLKQLVTICQSRKRTLK